MKWRSARRSSNVEDRRGMGMGGGGGGMKLGLGGVAVVVVIGLLLGKNPLEMLGLLAEMQQGAPGTGQPSGPAQAPPADDEASQFVASILGETEDVWGHIFQASGQQYPAPQLVLFSGRVNSACGGATAAVGPFYCPGDRKVYIDLSFFQQMQQRLGGGGDFAEAYVIAHEVGHHVQTITGVSAKVNEIRQRGGNVEGATGPLVRQELQADCYAGLWAHHAQQRHAWLEPGDLEEAMRTATAIGDDTLQRQGQGTVVPDSFTHGSAEQRVRWFRIGFESGDYRRCDTFAAAQL
ncbi:neutral zinc metallopeptidase [Arenimonas sp. MALMAid1274]|uniref:KPN_02809 family neutral zinc metallopeptidase n=1 Tax=Arenimonas sp. MALMAid1274 TaxID=3411630 RepID=UPI003B9F3809